MRKQMIILAGTFSLLFATMLSSTTALAKTIKVEKGDTLYSLSHKYQVSVKDLKKNNALHSNMIMAGSTLQLGSNEMTGNSLYTIKLGDTLLGISKKTNISLKKLKVYNNLSTDLIVAGTTLSLTNNDQKIKPGKKPVTKKAKTIAVSNPVAAKKETQQYEGRTLSMVATAYVADCPGCSGITATGIDVRNSTPNLIAVDPNVIPLGSKVWVEGYGEAIAGDTGGDIKGNRIDLLKANYDKAIQYGVQTVTVKILN